MWAYKEVLSSLQTSLSMIFRWLCYLINGQDCIPCLEMRHICTQEIKSYFLSGEINLKSTKQTNPFKTIFLTCSRNLHHSLPESLIMWVKNCFIPSWCLCDYMNLNIHTKFWVTAPCHTLSKKRSQNIHAPEGTESTRMYFKYGWKRKRIKFKKWTGLNHFKSKMCCTDPKTNISMYFITK